jgi:DeoR/GlpR family transcriptional regulator of sugar metabolism
MLAGQRQKVILDEVRRRGAVRVKELTEVLSVSEMTVRRDLDTLAESGLLEKVHGGATARGHLSTEELGFETNSHRQPAEKEAIAEAARRLVGPGQAIGLTAGTTTWRLAHLISEVPNLTVVTNSIQVADVLQREGRPDLTVVVTGGVRTPSDALVGPVAVGTISSLHLDLLFLGVHGMAEDAGFSSPNLLEAETDRAFIAAAERVVVLADSTKWGVRGLSRVARLDEAHVLVTDNNLAADAREALEAHVERVVLASVRGPRARRPSDATDGRS